MMSLDFFFFSGDVFLTDSTMGNHHFSPPFGRICLELFPFASFTCKSKILRGKCFLLDPAIQVLVYMCQGLNSHYFHIIGDGHQPNGRGLYTHYKDSY